MQTSQGGGQHDADMAKLQKSIKQHKRLSQSQDTTARLTPAGVRLMNNDVATAKRTGSSSNVHSHQGDTVTPPLTPEKTVSTESPASIQPTRSPPTPPRSPDGKASQRPNPHQGTVTHIYSPTPQSHSKPNFVLSANGSRPVSASSHRAMPTYRGPEVTRTGSISMLHQSVLTHQIVDNPLSQFSRPRRSRAGSSPSQQEPVQPSTVGQTNATPPRSQSISTVHSLPDQSMFSPRPVPSSARTTGESNPATGSLRTQAISLDNPEPAVTMSRTVSADEKLPTVSRSRFSWLWRKSSSGKSGADGAGDGTKADRRRSMIEIKDVASPSDKLPNDGSSLTKATNQLIDSQADQIVNAVRHDLDRPDNYISEEENLNSKAVVPSSSLTDKEQTDWKGKAREIVAEGRQDYDTPHDLLADTSIPMYSRCSCCGRLKRPDGDRPLSPVFENENLRTNFSLELEREDKRSTGRQRPKSAGRQKYTPIIPMVLSEDNIVQAKIAPKSAEQITPSAETVPTVEEKEPVVNERGDIIAINGEPFISKPRSPKGEEKEMTRFTSLHVKNVTNRSSLTGEARLGFDQIAIPGPQTRSKMLSTNPGADQPLTTATPQQRAPVSTRETSQQSQVTRSENNSVPKPSDESAAKLPTVPNQNVISQVTSHSAVSQYTRPSDFDVSQHVDRSSDKAQQQPESAQSIEPTTDEAVLQSSLRKSTDSLRNGPRAVSFDPSTVERADDDSPSGSIYRKALTKRKPVSNHPARGYATKPKATAQFVNYANPPSANGSKRNSVHSISSIASSSARSETGLTPGPPHLEHRRHSYVERSSRDFEPLPAPQLGKRFGGSSTTLKDYVYPQQKKQSRLVESVLAATRGGHDMGNFMNDLKR